ncbi:RNA-binding protein 25 [Chionoecetes opilio]|uniref:RNA-binding protein 25 n=1 Tax=Chionoecetes opilio TaxID=41210 RepID=A0A8J4YB25_CHIOP|nr:RNA-binding protein 25 [Chionoecetes opilio]
MAFNPRPPLMPGVPLSTMMGGAFSLASAYAAASNMVPAVGIPLSQHSLSQHSLTHASQTFSQIPTPASNRPPLRPTPDMNPNMGKPQGPNMGMNMKLPTYSKRLDASGPAVTVFVGNITEKAPDVMVRHILNTAGNVHSWKRVQGASGKLQAFGFCEFGNPDAALRAIRLLHDYEIADRKLVVKADAKTKEVLDVYKDKRKKSKQNGDASPLQDEQEEGEDYMDEEMRQEDVTALRRINDILTDHKKEIMNYIPPPNKNDMREKRMSKVQEKLVALSSGADIANIPTTTNLDDMEDVEEGKKELITREITQFREQMKVGVQGVRGRRPTPPQGLAGAGRHSAGEGR